jgi:zinc protease
MTTLLKNSHIHRTVLDNGIIVLVTENPTADIVAGRIFIRAGSCHEPVEKSGLAHLLSALLTKGCDGLSSMEIAEEVESVGASLGTDAAADYFLVSLKTVTADFANMLTLAGKIMRSPTFPEAEVELERRLALQDIRSQKEQPFNIAFEQLRLAMYQNHPYSQSGLGDETTMGNLTRDDLVQYHQTYFRPDNVVISIAGRIKSNDAIALIQKVFGDWQSPINQLIPSLDIPKVENAPYATSIFQQTQQSILMLGYLVPAVDSPDYAALKLLSTYLGNGLSSRLFVELREKRGLAYEVSAFYPTRLFTASFIVYMGTAPENTRIALDGLKNEVDLLSSAHLLDDSIQAAKNKILGQYALGKQTNSQIAQLYGWYETLGLGIDFDYRFQEMVTAVDAEQAYNVAMKYLLTPYISIVGQEAAVKKAIGEGGRE